MSERPLNDFFRDRANMLIAASVAGERLEKRAAAGDGPTVTLSRDELAEIAEQFQRMIALLTLTHLAEAKAAKERAAA